MHSLLRRATTRTTPYEPDAVLAYLTTTHLAVASLDLEGGVVTPWITQGGGRRGGSRPRGRIEDHGLSTWEKSKSSNSTIVVKMLMQENHLNTRRCSARGCVALLQA
jgi:hypothetical protein